MTLSNPYQPSATVDEADDAPDAFASPTLVDDRSRRNCIVTWTVILPLNLIMPIFFAMGLVQGPAWLGVAAAVLMVYAAGIWCCYRQTGIATRIMIGGSIVTLSQLVPILHMIFGMIALSLLAANVNDNFEGSLSAVQAFLMTVLVAIQLLTVSLMIGAVIYFIKQQMSPKNSAPKTSEMSSFS
ncbi:hypothetical protein [Rhodopirellula sp. MGV]|uniref:hypothetical protein n=1 Tax=Rhodopirellula sp. MGV TaxID=2023130 RepID=UPI000B979F67|nr:hypothetical protein [Rhodopirellula sp. MGV]OYP30369.1 hypothetical protein CGZ80_23125 [Rhodopirellula sp. MGV]PNY34726.1 hypothetical protein C2E31_22470 [Rhodopirellula baltica]